MKEVIPGNAAELEETIATILGAFYARRAPTAQAGGFARLHRACWDRVLSGETSFEAFAELRAALTALLNADHAIEACNREIIWALTPVIGASLACGPGDDRISLREVRSALEQILQASQRAPEAEQAFVFQDQRVAA